MSQRTRKWLPIGPLGLAAALIACGDLDPLAPTVAKLVITPPSASISSCDAGQNFSASAFGPDGAAVDTRIAKVQWSVSDPSKASISDTGLLTPKDAGKIDVIAKVLNQSASSKASITISRDNTVTSLRIGSSPNTIGIGGTINLQVSAVNRCDQPVDAAVGSYNYSVDPNDGSISGNTFTAKRGGSVNISASLSSDPSKTASGFINVRFPSGLPTGSRQSKRFFERSVKVAGLTQNERTNFYEYLPNDFASDPAKKYPLLLFFPGAGTPTPDSSGDTLPTEVLAKNTSDPSLSGMIVLTPFFPDITQESPWQPERIQAIINHAKTRYPIDETRIYLTGFSFGGGAVWNFVGSSKQNADQIAAVAVVAGSLRFFTKQYLTDPAAFAGVGVPADAYDFQGLGCNLEASNLPIRASHSPSDLTVSPIVTQTVIAAIECLATPNKISPSPQYITTDLAGLDHDKASARSWSTDFKPTQGAGKNVYEWLLQFKR